MTPGRHSLLVGNASGVFAAAVLLEEDAGALEVELEVEVAPEFEVEGGLCVASPLPVLLDGEALVLEVGEALLLGGEVA